MEELPAYIDDDTGLIIIEFVIAGTELDCRLASQAEGQTALEKAREEGKDDIAAFLADPDQIEQAKAEYQAKQEAAKLEEANQAAAAEGGAHADKLAFIGWV
eukprot:COSAG04_NODE_1920_length_5221_cov_10.665170_2_plen_102_part_00